MAIIIGTFANDVLNGLVGNDVLIGLNGNDILNGNAGADVMIGGTGNDIYFVDNAGDVVAEGFGEGIDTIRSSISTSLSLNGRFAVENLSLVGTALVGVGNALNNLIVGNNFANTLSGLAGNDTLRGLGGNDLLFGGIGDDRLDGGAGIDTMRGELGNDTYIVDNAGDVVIELAGAGSGIDRIISSVSTSLNFGGRVNVENLTLTGAAVVGIGNGLGNSILGDANGNVLSGLAGADSITGLGGNDTILGGAGRDVLTGGTGDDVFRYVLATDSPANIFRDVITDFDDFGNDRIDLSAVFGGVLAFRGILPFTGAGQVRINDIAGPDVFVEVNLGGTLAPEMQIHLTNTTAASMTITDFIL